MRCKAQTNVLTTILLVAIAIVAVLIVFNVVKPIISKKSEGIETGMEKYIEELEKSMYSQELDVAPITGDTIFSDTITGNYIIQFEDKPVIEKKNELEKQARKNQEKGFLTQIFGIMPEDVDREVKEYSEDLEKDNRKIKEKIKTKIKDARIKNEFTKVFNGISLTIDKSKINEIKKIPEIKAIYPNLIVNITLMDSVPLINADAVWQLDDDGNDCSVSGKPCLTGQGISIAIIDTGIDYTHGDLGGCFGAECKVIGGYDFVNTVDMNNDGDFEDCFVEDPDGIYCEGQISMFPDCQFSFGADKNEDGDYYDLYTESQTGDICEEDLNPMDDNGHGTHCAGIAAGNGILNGVAPDANLYAYKVLGSGGLGNFDDIIASIERAIDPNQDGDFSDNVDVISMSLGGKCDTYSKYCGPDDPVSQTVDNAVKAGVIAVIAAGNEGPFSETILSPGTARKAITIGATYKKYYEQVEYSSCTDNNVNADDITCFSSRGPVVWDDGKKLNKPDLVAPGAIICSAQWNDAWNDKKCDGLVDEEHVQIPGTSMATPHVAGAAALLLQKNPTWTPYEIKDALKNTAFNLPYTEDEVGKGRLDILSAIALNQQPDVAEINTIYGEVKGVINIEGTASSSFFQNYKLEYGEGTNPTEWIELKNSDSQVHAGILYENLDTTTLSEGVISLKLTVFNTLENKISDIDYINVNNIYITSPQNEGIFTKEDGIIKIIGTARGSNFQNYELKIGGGKDEWFTTGITLNNRGNTEIIDNTLGELNIEELTTIMGVGFYTLKLIVYNTDGKIKEDNILIGIEGYMEGWPQKIKEKHTSHLGVSSNSLFSSPSVADLDNNGDLEVVVGGGDKDNHVYAFNHDGSFVDGWPITTDYDVLSSPALADLDGDNDMEIIIADGNYIKPPYSFTEGKIYAFQHDGSLIWSYHVPYIFSTRSPSIGDIDNNGDLEVIIGTNKLEEYTGTSQGAEIYAFNHDGSFVDGWPILIESPNPDVEMKIISTPSLADLDNNGDLEIIIGTSLYQHVFNHDGTYFDGNNDGIADWPQQICLKDLCDGSLYPRKAYWQAVGDIDDNGDLDIVIFATSDSIDSSDGRYSDIIHIFNKDGTKHPGFPLELPESKYYNSLPVLADINDDGYLEIIGTVLSSVIKNCGANVGISSVTIIDKNGEYIWPIGFKEIQGGKYCPAGTIIADIDGDTSMEILTTGCYVCKSSDDFTSTGRIHAWHHTGEEVLGFPKFLFDQADSSTLSLNDFDEDRKIELIGGIAGIAADGGWIYALDLGLRSTYNPSKVEWRMFAHDIRHTGLYAKENCRTLGDEDLNGLVDCKDPICPDGTFCNEEYTKRCYNGECVSRSVGRGITRTCREHSDCQEQEQGEYCIDGKCMFCEIVGESENGEVTMPSDEEPEDQPFCEEHSECENGKFCIQGMCVECDYIED